jgi:hypothetical protein
MEPVFLGITGDFGIVIDAHLLLKFLLPDVTEAFEEEEAEDVVLEIRGINFSPE